MTDGGSMWSSSNLSPLLNSFLSFEVLRFFRGIFQAFQMRIVLSQLPEMYYNVIILAIENWKCHTEMSSRQLLLYSTLDSS